jgi:hypothetical protein
MAVWATERRRVGGERERERWKEWGKRETEGNGIYTSAGLDACAVPEKLDGWIRGNDGARRRQ